MITQKELRETLHYNPETGVFTWRKSRAGVGVGSCAGTKNANGYIIICCYGKLYRAHRLAWLYMTGEWPKDQVDHENHIRHDNRWENLREATRQENHKNRSMYKNNTSGVTGVYWDKGKWKAYIRVDEKDKNLGRFTDKFEAICARKSGDNKYGYHENHGAA